MVIAYHRRLGRGLNRVSVTESGELRLPDWLLIFVDLHFLAAKKFTSDGEIPVLKTELNSLVEHLLGLEFDIVLYQLVNLL